MDKILRQRIIDTSRSNYIATALNEWQPHILTDHGWDWYNFKTDTVLHLTPQDAMVFSKVAIDLHRDYLACNLDPKTARISSKSRSYLNRTTYGTTWSQDYYQWSKKDSPINNRRIHELNLRFIKVFEKGAIDFNDRHNPPVRLNIPDCYGPTIYYYPSWHPLICHHKPSEWCHYPSAKCGYDWMTNIIQFKHAFITSNHKVLENIENMPMDDDAYLSCKRLKESVYDNGAPSYLVQCHWEDHVKIDDNGRIPLDIAMKRMFKQECTGYGTPENWYSIERSVIGDEYQFLGFNAKEALKEGWALWYRSQVNKYQF